MGKESHPYFTIDLIYRLSFVGKPVWRLLGKSLFVCALSMESLWVVGKSLVEEHCLGKSSVEEKFFFISMKLDILISLSPMAMVKEYLPMNLLNMEFLNKDNY